LPRRDGGSAIPTSDSLEERERSLRHWFTRDQDPVQRRIDGLDIGWGGVQRWATERMPPVEDLHLDLCCGYATFLAQLGWRFPTARLVGVNIDFHGPHALAPELLGEAGVIAHLVRGDARTLPFPDATFGSVSCFLGLQDVEIGFGESGMRQTVGEAVRVVRPGGVLTVLDELTFERYDALLNGLPIAVTDRAERAIHVRWDRETALRAISLYADGYSEQIRSPDAAPRALARAEAYARMERDMEDQLARQGYYVPFGPIRMVVAGKLKP
jgi:ubiquinone/menaquinone biosynthesis C-methylase UbiE